VNEASGRRDLIEQGAKLCAVVKVVGGQLRRDNPASVWIDTKMHCRTVMKRSDAFVDVGRGAFFARTAAVAAGATAAAALPTARAATAPSLARATYLSHSQPGQHRGSQDRRAPAANAAADSLKCELIRGIILRERAVVQTKSAGSYAGHPEQE
jgi:hypothetical protein